MIRKFFFPGPAASGLDINQRRGPHQAYYSPTILDLSMHLSTIYLSIYLFIWASIYTVAPSQIIDPSLIYSLINIETFMQVACPDLILCDYLSIFYLFFYLCISSSLSAYITYIKLYLLYTYLSTYPINIYILSTYALLIGFPAFSTRKI